MVHTWKILDLERIADSGLINKITYECNSTHGDMSSRHIGHAEISGSVDSATFVDFDSLTHDTVLSWLDSNINKSEVEAKISQSIREEETEISSSIRFMGGTPWDN